MSDAESLRKGAKLAYKAHDYAGAAELFARLVDNGAGTPAAAAADLQGYATALIALSRLDEAATALESAIALSSGDGRLRHKLAEVHSRLGRHEDAVAQLGEAIRLEANDADHFWRLAVELRLLGRDDEATSAARRCLELDPSHTDAQLFQIEAAVLQTAERDGLADEAGEVSSPSRSFAGSWRTSGDNPRSPLLRANLWLIVLEAVAIFGAALWLRVFMS